MKMRRVNSRERNAIREYLLEFKVDISVLKGKLVRIGKKVFLVDEEILRTAREIERMGKTPYAVGVEIGTLSKGFEPSIELADLISGSTDAETVITEEGEKLFSYGRDVFLQNIVEGNEEGSRIVVNEDKEVLGLGLFDGEMLRNVIDKGFYLRGKKGRR
jgi:60S ribosome subunit biogenesis protein NIP7